MDALCLLGETKGHLPDPRAAKNVLEVLSKLLGIEVDLKGLDESIRKADRIEELLSEVEVGELLTGEAREGRETGPGYGYIV